MLKVGDSIPKLTVLNQHSEPVQLPLNQKCILFFYPKDNTPGCTAEACSIRDGYQELLDLGYSIFGISTDSPKSHLKFIEKHHLPFPLLSDENKEMVKAFGVWGPKKFMGREYEGTTRATFVVNENGQITHLIEKVETKDAANQLLDILGK